jgi:hypothetical protein
MSNGFVSYLSITETSTNSAANTSVVSYSLWIDPPGNYTSYNLTSSDQSYSITINGSVVASGGFTYDFRSPNQNVNKTIKTGTVTIAHNTDGSKTVAASASVNTSSSTVGDASITSFNTVLTDFVFVPATPTVPTITRDSAKTTLTVTSAAVSSAVSISDYEYRWSTDNSNWSAAVSMGTDRVATFSGTATQIYYFQTRAISSEGTGSYSSSGVSYGVPTAPASINLSRTGRNVTVTWSAPASNGGSAVTDYLISYSTDGGSSYSTAISAISLSQAFTDLTAGLTYLFRIQAVNIQGAGAYVSSSIFVPAGGQRWTGTTFTPTATAKRFDGTTFVDITTAKRFNGTTWVDLS